MATAHHTFTPASALAATIELSLVYSGFLWVSARDREEAKRITLSGFGAVLASPHTSNDVQVIDWAVDIHPEKAVCSVALDAEFADRTFCVGVTFDTLAVIKVAHADTTEEASRIALDDFGVLLGSISASDSRILSWEFDRHPTKTVTSCCINA